MLIIKLCRWDIVVLILGQLDADILTGVYTHWELHETTGYNEPKISCMNILYIIKRVVCTWFQLADRLKTKMPVSKPLSPGFESLFNVTDQVEFPYNT